MKPDIVDVPGIIKFLEHLLNDHMQLTRIERPDRWEPPNIPTYLEYYGKTSTDFQTFREKWESYEGWDLEPPSSSLKALEGTLARGWSEENGTYSIVYTTGGEPHLPTAEHLPYIMTMVAFEPGYFGDEDLVVVYVTYKDPKEL